MLPALLVACTGDDTMSTGTPDAAADASGGLDSGAPDSGPRTEAGAPDAPSESGADEDASDAGPSVDAPADTGPAAPANAVYTMSNAAAGNAILGFLRADDGTLTPMATPFPTGGAGSGAGLGEQGAVAYDTTNDRIYAVNAGDNSFSILPVNADGTLGAAVKVDTGAAGDAGATLVGPKSVTFWGDTAYVLFEGNATTASRISGWTIGTAASGAPTATAIAGSTLELSSATQSVDPAQIQFTPDGKWLVVTEKQGGTGTPVVAGPGSIDTFAVDANGLATKTGFYPTASAGQDAGLQKTPFGFSFSNGFLIVSEAGSTGVGSYSYTGGAVAPVPGSSQFLPTDAAPCWVAVVSNLAYVANARGPDISGFTVSATGALANIGSAANAVVASTGKTVPTADGGTTFEGPTDEFVSADGKYLYALNAAVPSIGIFQIGADGTLTRVGSTDYTPAIAAALPAGSAGIVAR